MKLPRFTFSRTFAFGAALLVLTMGLIIGFVGDNAARAQKEREARIQAQTLAASVTAPLMFADAAAAQEYVTALAANPQIVSVAVYDERNARVASIGERASQLTPGAPYRGAYLRTTAPVSRDGTRYGSVILEMRTDTLTTRIARYAPIGMLALMAALVLFVAGAAQGELGRTNAELKDANTQLAAEIEQRKEVEEALLQSRKMEAIGQLTGGVAHDFNNLLMVVSGGLRMLERHADPQRRERTIAAMQQAVERGAGLTRQLLAFSRRQAMQLEAIDLDRQVNGMRELLERSLRADILLDIAFPTGLPPVKTDPGQFELAILNLSVNARDAMPKGGVLAISARKSDDGGFVDVSVKDTGTGIAPEILDRIFEPYFTTKQVGHGTGLGLSQVYGFAQQGGGSVRIETALGHGTTFILSLPISDAPSLKPPKTEHKESAPRAAAREVLMVEDDDQVAAAVVLMLEDIGHRPTRARSALEALELLKSQGPFDLVFSDIVMPGGKSGIELARELEKLAPDMPVLLTTGYSGQNDGSFGRPVLRKPYQVHELRSAIAALPVRRSV